MLMTVVSFCYQCVCTTFFSFWLPYAMRSNAHQLHEITSINLSVKRWDVTGSA